MSLKKSNKTIRHDYNQLRSSAINEQAISFLNNYESLQATMKLPLVY